MAMSNGAKAGIAAGVVAALAGIGIAIAGGGRAAPAARPLGGARPPGRRGTVRGLGLPAKGCGCGR